MNPDHDHDEIWLIEATPTDPAKRPFLLGEGPVLSVIFHSQEEAERRANEMLPAMRSNGVSDFRVVRVRIDG